MCFSAGASFAASGGLAVVGTASWRLAHKKQKLIAIVPFLFAVQQAFEGFQWLYARSGATSAALGYSFMFFAFLLWPIYIPATVFILDEKRRNVLKWLVVIGVGVSLLLLGLLLLEPLTVHVLKKSIHYQLDSPVSQAATMTVLVLYLVATAGSLIVSSKAAFRWIGILGLLSAVIAGAYFFQTFISVWCYFAAILSSLIYFFLRDQHRMRQGRHPGRSGSSIDTPAS